MGNTFKGNSVLKGIINIQMMESASGNYPIVIFNNEFIQNGAFYSTNAIHIRLYSIKQYLTSFSN